MNIIAKFKTPAEVPNPPSGYGALFIQESDSAPKIKLPSGEVLTLQGLQGLQGIQGIQGDKGDKGDKGDAGDVTPEAEAAKVAAQSAASAAQLSDDNAATSATNAENSALAAQAAETNAETAETNAETAQSGALAAQAAAESARDSSINMAESFDVAVSGLNAGETPTAIYDNETFLLSLGIPKGDKGDNGDAGEIVSVSIETTPVGTPPSVENVGTPTEAELVFSFPATATRKFATLDFSNGDTIQRFTITDATVTPTYPPCGLSIYSPSTEGEDLEIAYSVNLVSVSTGSFVVTVLAYDPEGLDLLGLTLPSVNLSYLTGV